MDLNSVDMTDVPSQPPIGGRIKLWLQYIAPHCFVCWIMYLLTRTRLGIWKNWQIKWFIKRYKVDMSQSVIKNHEDFVDFNAFFTRELVDGARTMPDHPKAIASPADGTIADFGTIKDGILIQAKSHPYTLQALVGGDTGIASQFEGGEYLTVYLSPRDYHRVHMPIDGLLTDCIHVPGRRYAVNTQTAAAVPGLYALNERVVSLFETPAGPMAVILVGAMFVGSMETVWPTTCWRKPGITRTTDFDALSLQRGNQLGRFNMGSTVIILSGPNMLSLSDSLTFNQAIMMGETVGQLK